jgi:hypothetical protein
MRRGSTSTTTAEAGNSAIGRMPRPSSTLPASAATHTSTRGSDWTLRWSTGSNVRSDSISSPNISTRSGSSDAKGKTSRISPRRLISPGRSDSGTRA